MSPWPARTLVILLAICCAAALAPLAPVAVAAPTLDTPVDVSGTPGRIAEGPDGNIWVLLGGGGTNEIAMITPAGVKTEFDVDLLIGAAGLTAGSDGNLWATKTGKIVRVPPADPTTATQSDVTGLDAQDIVTGPDTNLWAGSNNDVFKIVPGATPTPTELTDILGPAGSARGIASGGDGRLWIADFGQERVARVATTGGTPDFFAVGPGLQGIAAGPGSQVAATQPNAADTSIARISPGGSAEKTPLGAVDPFGIAFGTDGAYWAAQFSGENLGRLTPDGQYTTPITFPANSGPRRITRGPGNSLWVSLETSKKVAIVRGVDPVVGGGESGAGGGSGAGGTVGAKDVFAPGVTGFGISDTTVVVGSAPTPLTGTAADTTGTTIRYTLTEAATVKLRIDRGLSGRRVRKGKRRVCAKPTRKNRRKRKCSRFKTAGTLTRTSRTGKNSVKFTGRIGTKALKVGKYRLTITATDAAGNKSKPKSLSFRAVKPKRKRR